VTGARKTVLAVAAAAAVPAIVEAHGGRLIHHLFLRRGRIFWQKSARSC